MATIYKAEFVSLHVRKSNRAAIGLYRDTLGFTVHATEAKYCKHGTFSSSRATLLTSGFIQTLTEKTLWLCVYLSKTCDCIKTTEKLCNGHGEGEKEGIRLSMAW